jgi:hypothetical protein
LKNSTSTRNSFFANVVKDLFLSDLKIVNRIFFVERMENGVLEKKSFALDA